ncbi:MAG: ACT domain-containing protein [Armatimonadota bacterium]
MFSVPHKSGALYNALQAFDDNGINMTMIESRPTKQMPWEYIFFIDLLGHEQDEKIQQALKRLNEIAMFVRVLGSYPEAE